MPRRELMGTEFNFHKNAVEFVLSKYMRQRAAVRPTANIDKTRRPSPHFCPLPRFETNPKAPRVWFSPDLCPFRDCTLVCHDVVS